MLVDAIFLPVSQMRKVKPALDTVVISVLDESEKHHRPRLEGFRSVLTLSFEDTSEEAWGEEPGSWPDAPGETDHVRLTVGVDERIPTLKDAQRIVAFLQAHHRSDERLHLVTHCLGGISRSAAIALWAARRLYVPLIDGGTRTCDGANRRLLRLMDKASPWHVAAALL